MDKKMIYLLTVLLCISLTLSGCQLARILATNTAPSSSLAETTGPASESSATAKLDAPAQKPLFDFYTIPASWPRVVPIMSEFQVTLYEQTETGMQAQGYAKVEIIRAVNFYTNALKKHVSSNIWEQDPDKPSGDEEKKVFFNYIGEGSKLAVILEEATDGYIYFELTYTKAEPGPSESNPLETSSNESSPSQTTTQPSGMDVDLAIFLIGSWMQVTESKTAPRPVLIIFYDGTLDSNTATPGPLDSPQSWLGGSWQLGEPLEGSWESQADTLSVSFPDAEDSSFSSRVLALDEDSIQLEIAGETVLYQRLPVS